MLIIEWIDGIRIDDVDALTKAGHNIGKITEIAASSFFRQVFRDGYFHADMHPGNIFIRSDGMLVPIDFGIMGFLDFKDRLFLAKLLNALLDRNYELVAKLHRDGMLRDDLHLFAQSIRAVTDPAMDKVLGDVSLGIVLGRILKLPIVLRLKFKLNSIFAKTMGMAEGAVRQLNPSADMWKLARPLVDDWIKIEARIKKQAEIAFEDM